MKKGNKENQHYVPQFYLRNFSDNGKNIGMYRFNGEKFIQNASIKSVAYRKYLYGEDGQLENILSLLENKWQRLIKKIINNQSINEILTLSEYKSLLEFITISQVRTSKLADDYIEYCETMLKANEEMRKNHGTNEPSKFDNQFRKLKEIPNAIAILGAHKEGKDLLKGLYPLLLVNKTNYNFITCDNPIIQYNQLYRYRNYLNNYGWGSAGIQMFIILNPKIALCLYDAFVYDVKETGEFYLNIIAKNQIMEINKLVAHNAYEALFFNKVKEENIKNIIKDKQKVDPKNSTRLFYKHGDKDSMLVGFGNRSIIRKVKLEFFNIKNKYKTIPLPLHAGGLVREDMLMEKIIKKMNGEDNEY